MTTARTTDKMAELIELYLNKHYTLAEIGKMYGITRQGVYCAFKRHGVSTKTAERFTVKCSQCDNEFSINRKRWRKAKAVYCSTTCYHKHLSNPDYKPSRQGQRKARAILGLFKGQKAVAHHEDGDCNNNNPDNLLAFPSQSAHKAYHHSLKARSKNEQYR